jgi:hypothetical protein
MLIKKADVKKYFADRRASGIAATPPFSRPDAAGLVKVAPGGTKAGQEESFQDLDPASSNGSATLIAGDSSTSEAATVAGSLQA